MMKHWKTFVPLLSMLVALGAYALVFPLYFAIGLTLMILVHELGHILAAKQKGIPVSSPLFIPFIGAFIAMRRNPQDAATEAYVAMGGPIAGTAVALFVYLLGLFLREPTLIITANIGFYLNLINLLPVHPLDGGRIVSAVSRWLWLAGLILGLIAVVIYWNLFYLILWLIFAWQVLKKTLIRKPHDGQYYVLPPKIRWRYGLAYLGLIMLLLYLISTVHAVTPLLLDR